MITHVQYFSVLYETQQQITVCCIWHCSWVAVGTFCREGVLDLIKILLYGCTYYRRHKEDTNDLHVILD